MHITARHITDNSYIKVHSEWESITRLLGLVTRPKNYSKKSSPNQNMFNYNHSYTSIFKLRATY